MEKTYKILKLLILVLIMVALLLVANMLYKNLGSRVEMDALATQPKQESAQAPEEAGAEETTEPLEPAPDFTVYDLEGTPHKLSDFRGKPVVLNFWASWCGPCKSEMPAFEEKYLQYGEQLHFLMVNLTDGAQETVDSASSFISGQGYTFPVYYDTDMEAAYAYGVSSVPVTYFIDAEGNFVAWGQGAMSGDILQKGIDMLINP